MSFLRWLRCFVGWHCVPWEGPHQDGEWVGFLCDRWSTYVRLQ